MSRSPEKWTYYRLEDGEVLLVIGETADFVWVLDPLSGEQRDVDRPAFVDGLIDGSIERVQPTYEAVDPADAARTQGAGA